MRADTLLSGVTAPAVCWFAHELEVNRRHQQKMTPWSTLQTDQTLPSIGTEGFTDHIK